MWVKVVSDYKAANEEQLSAKKGEKLQVLATDSENSPVLVLVQRRTSDPAAAPGVGWVPVSILAPSSSKHSDCDFKRPWKQRFRKMAFKKDCRGCSFPSTNGVPFLPLSTKDSIQEIDENVTRVTVHEGDPATLVCCFEETIVETDWRNPDGAKPASECILNEGGIGMSSLNLSQTVLSHSGTYVCTATTQDGRQILKEVLLSVVGRPSCPGKPAVIQRNTSSTGVRLCWDPPVSDGNLPIVAYTVEYCELGLDSVWQVAVAFCPDCQQAIEDLRCGRTYRFRISANNEAGISEPGPPSDPFTVPDYEERLTANLEETMVFWKTGMEKDFEVISELGRGRFATLKRCRQKANGFEVAVKLIARTKSDVEDAQREFLLLKGLQHRALVQGLDTYQTPQCFVLILQLVSGQRVFDFVTEDTVYDESVVRGYTAELLDAVRYLHDCRIAHLDIKPENCLVDMAHISPRLRLIDFGDARFISSEFYVHPLFGSPEFASPELVSGGTVSLQSDLWSIGVLLYVFLSGVSPYLDESVEETCSNIVRNDFSFPEDYFSHVTPAARDLIGRLLVTEAKRRQTARECLESAWIKEGNFGQPMSTSRLRSFIERRKHEVSFVKVSSRIINSRLSNENFTFVIFSVSKKLQYIFL